MLHDQHITINLTQDEYKKLLDLARSEERKPSNMAYLLLRKSLNERNI